MSRVLPSELKFYILSYVPIIQLQRLNLDKKGLITILNFRYNLDNKVSNRLTQYSILTPSLVFLKTATLFGDSAPGQEMFFSPMFCAINAILKNNLEMVVYYCRRIDFYHNLSLLDTYLSLATKYAGTEINYLIKSFCAAFSGIPRTIEQVKNIEPFYDPDYPVYQFNDYDNFNPHPDIYYRIIRTLTAFDFAGLYATPRAGVSDVFPPIGHIYATLLPSQLFVDLDVFVDFISTNFKVNDDLLFYLTLLDILGNKPIDLTLIKNTTQLDNIAVVACSVLHQQVPQIVELLPPNQNIQIIPSEKLYHLEFIQSVLKLQYQAPLDNIKLQLSMWICNRQIEQVGGIEQLTYIESKNSDLRLYRQVTVDNAASVKVLKSKVKGNETIIMSPVSYVEYTAMQEFESNKIIFDIPFTNNIDKDVETWDKVMNIYSELTTDLS